MPWFYLSETLKGKVTERINDLEPIHNAIRQQDILMRIGQALEIAVYRALLAQNKLEYLGGFLDLNDHDDGDLYKKEEPPSLLAGRAIPNQRRLDFLIHHPSAGWAGIEIKNIREWLYPDRTEIKDLLGKCVHLNAVPVLIARRAPYVSRRLFEPCGMVIWETFGQRYPASEHELAAKAKHKKLLGFHDIKLGNEPGPHLTQFLTQFLPDALPAARERFDEHTDLLEAFAIGEMDYAEFAARVRRREDGTTEDHDWYDEPSY
ncbi:MAG: hypothetical protein MI824_07910 [Hyphomicrobiales bacterium]|nr:hypothetical protein [Hyphomicrobiales bacterium]